MAWTAPRTWVASEVTTAALFNTHLRDNMSLLATSIGTDGKLKALSSSYVADLDGTKLGGVVPLNGTPAIETITGYTLSNGQATKSAANGWGNSGLISKNYRVSGDATRAAWVITGSPLQDAVFGLSADFGALDYAALDYVFYFGVSGTASSSIVENGSVKLASQTFTVGDKLEIDVSAANVVKYYRNGTLLYTSATAAATNLYFCYTSYYNANVASGFAWTLMTLRTAGKHAFSDPSRLVIPVGTDKFDGYAGDKTPGSLWVEGNYLHHVAESTKVEWRYLGTSVGASAGTVGSVWVDTDAMLHYIDSSGVERYVLSSSYPHADGAAVGGSLWAEGYLHWANTGGQEYEGHADTHSDGTSHSDVAHTNTHSDTHGDVAHDDVAASHADTHADHTDGGHADTHGDVTVPHTDVAHTDTYSDTHGDVSHADHSDHADVAHDDRPESIGT